MSSSTADPTTRDFPLVEQRDIAKEALEALEQTGLTSSSRPSSQEPVKLEDDNEDDDEDRWSDYSSDYDYDSSYDYDYYKICGMYGAYVVDRTTGKMKTFYWSQIVTRNPYTSCNAAAAALKEPVSLLTKYRHARSNYFDEVFIGPSKPLRTGSQVLTSSRLNEIHVTDDRTLDL